MRHKRLTYNQAIKRLLSTIFGAGFLTGFIVAFILYH